MAEQAPKKRSILGPLFGGCVILVLGIVLGAVAVFGTGVVVAAVGGVAAFLTLAPSPSAPSVPPSITAPVVVSSPPVPAPSEPATPAPVEASTTAPTVAATTTPAPSSSGTASASTTASSTSGGTTSSATPPAETPASTTSTASTSSSTAASASGDDGSSATKTRPTEPAGAKVSVEGEAKVVLIGADGKRCKVPGSCAPGKYEIEALFEGEPAAVVVGKVTVTDGGATIACNANMGICRPK